MAQLRPSFLSLWHLALLCPSINGATRARGEMSSLPPGLITSCFLLPADGSPGTTHKTQPQEEGLLFWGGRSHITVVQPGLPRKQDDPSVPKYAMKKELQEKKSAVSPCGLAPPESLDIPRAKA